ncbi:MAG TPA: hypothetical protein VEC75_08135, partial [Stellaceae bacterium]|nr:hypothetical protein [Stellaceae bacterium]
MAPSSALFVFVYAQMNAHAPGLDDPKSAVQVARLERNGKLLQSLEQTLARQARADGQNRNACTPLGRKTQYLPKIAI